MAESDNELRFDYAQAFSRNIGWVTEQEQQVLRHRCAAIAGAGGVGGVHLLTLARMGVGAFNLADFDTFDVPNFNRQAGAFVSTLGQPKVEVMARMARDINPEVKIRVFPQGVNQGNLREFLQDADVYVDGLDFFAFEARRQTYAMCEEMGVPATCAAPLGMGVAALNFVPGGMSFEDYFGWGNLPELEMAIRFLVGLAPAGLHRSYLVPGGINLAERRGASTAMACQLCSGVAATQAIKMMLKRGNIRAAPHGFQYDAYRDKYVHTWRPGGNRHPLQWLAIQLARRKINALLAQQGGGKI
ncbi:ThiF family adenylyltransferase [Pseudoduganella eburnea]|uniref:ThiF family adenylyltransferase n=1 Tax=Massilia eburnea TaxID=1776165 RepID=A0A6L6QF60_9BURK|nr:ThiF family adenylyltransferase [Massilia eburnea]MTW10885.1 ThiF family adenylyltransferase [Massilia eburnea]